MNLSLFQIFNPEYDLCAGLSFSGDRYHYILVAIAKGKTPLVMHTNTGEASLLKIPLGIPVHTHLSNAPALLVKDEFAPHTPEEWIDQNESRVIPRGVTSHEIINEWCIIGETIYSGTITKKGFQKALELFPPNKVMIASLCLPLWNLAVLYGTHIQGPFIIWKLTKNGSTLGYVDKGMLSNSADFWVGQDDLAAGGDEIREEFRSVAKSLSFNAENPCIVVSGCENVHYVLEFVKNAGYVVVKNPVIKNVPPDFHEAYSLALHQDTTLDFAPVDYSQNSREIGAARQKSLKLLKSIGIFLIIALLALCVLKGGSKIADHYVAKKMAPVQKYFEQYKNEQNRLSSRTLLLQKKTQFLSQKSALTFPLMEFQSAFPEGVWAEEISFAQGVSESWNCTIIAFSSSSESISTLINNISKIHGMAAVRMVYSEQSAGKGKTEHAIKFRVEANWKGGV